MEAVLWNARALLAAACDVGDVSDCDAHKVSASRRKVAWLRQYAFYFMNAYLKLSVLVCLLHTCVMLSGRAVTISYPPDSRYQNITLECSSFDACVQSHVAFFFHGNLK